MVLKRVIFDFTIPALYNAGIRSWSYDWLKSVSDTGLYDINIITPIPFSELQRFGNVIVVPYTKIRVPLIHRFWYYHFKFRPQVKQMKSGTLISPYFQLPKSILKTRKCIVCIHDTLYYDLSGYYNRLDLYILKLITNYFHTINLKYSHGILTVSSFSRRRIKELFNKECLGIFYNVPQIMDLNKDSILHLSEKKYFVYFGGWERRKRAHEAMRIAQYILHADSELIFVVSGVSSFDTISQFFDKDSKKRVLFENRFSKSQMLEFYRKSKFSLYTSAFEGFGIPLIESQLFGLPVVIFDDLELTHEIPKVGIITINEVSEKSASEILLAAANVNSTEIKITARNQVKLLQNHNEDLIVNLYGYL